MNQVENRSRTSAALPITPLIYPVLLLIAFGLAGATAHAAQSVTLAWDSSPDPTVAGYYVHYGTASQVYNDLVDSGGTTSATVDGLSPGQTYFFVVTAYNQLRVESAPSQEIAYQVPEVVIPPDPAPGPAAGPLRIVHGPGLNPLPRLQFLVPPATQYEIQASEDMKSWTRIRRDVSLSTNWIDYVDPQAAVLPKRFYRLALPDAPQVPGVISLVDGLFPEGALRLTPQVSPGERYQIQVSVDFFTWTTIHEGICSSAKPMDFVDAQARLFPNRYYRLRFPDAGPSVSYFRLQISRTSGGRRIKVATLEGQSYRIEASQDLVTWTTIHQGIESSTNPAELIDPDAGLYPKRFYRLAFD